MPPSAGLPRFDHRADVTGMGLVSLALILGRPLRADEYPHRIPDLLNEVRERRRSARSSRSRSRSATWLARSLQIDVRRSFASAPEAMAALEEVVSDEGMYVAAPVALETFLSRYIASLLEPPTPEIAHVDPVPPIVSKPADPHAAKPAQAEPAKPVEKEIETRFDAVVSQQHGAAHDPVAPKQDSTLAGTRELTDLLGPDPLPAIEPIGASAPKPLFNPDAPFTAMPVAPLACQAARARMARMARMAGSRRSSRWSSCSAALESLGSSTSAAPGRFLPRWGRSTCSRIRQGWTSSSMA